MEHLSNVIFLVLDILMGCICLLYAFGAYKNRYYKLCGFLLIAVILDALAAIINFSKLT